MKCTRCIKASHKVLGFTYFRTIHVVHVFSFFFFFYYLLALFTCYFSLMIYLFNTALFYMTHIMWIFKPMILYFNINFFLTMSNVKNV